MDMLLSSLAKGILGQTMDDGQRVDRCLEQGKSQAGDSCCRKRARRSTAGSRTPVLVPAEDDGTIRVDQARPVKRRRGTDGRSHQIVIEDEAVTESEECRDSGEGASLLALPEDLIAHCLSFLGGVEDRFSLQCTNRQFRRISNSDEMLIGIQVGGDKVTGLNGIISEKDTPESASDNLAPFALAGNLEAIYMLGIILSYCNQNVESGINLLRAASAQGYVRASYALGLVLRDSHPKEAAEYMTSAANARYIPALQEVLPPRQMKAQYGEPKAEELRRHLDPLCLNRLLSRHYVKSADLRELNTSHCWNPLCGRWAFKAVTVAPGGVRGVRQRRHAAHRRAAALSRQNNRENLILSDPAPLDNNAVLYPFILSGTSQISNARETIGVPPSRTPQSLDIRVSRMKMCSRCCRAKYCSKLCQVYDWRSGRHKMECQFL